MKKSIALLVALVLVIGFIGCGYKPSVAAPASASDVSGTSDTIIVKYSTTFPASGTQADGAARLGELLAEKSGEKLKMEFYAASMLGDKIASMEGLRSGTTEMTTSAITDLSSYSSIWSVFSLPYLWESSAQAVNVLSDPAVEKVLKADAEANGFIIITWLDAGSRSMLNKVRAVKTPTDLNGLRVRCMEDPVLVSVINAMGASATPLAWSECYTALQQGIIDGIENNIPTILDNGMAEVAKYYSQTEHFIIPDLVFVSKVWFDNLSAETQKAIIEAGKQFTSEYSKTIWPNAEKSAMSRFESQGVQVNKVDKDAFIEATKAVIDDFLADADENQVALYELLMQVRKNY